MVILWSGSGVQRVNFQWKKRTCNWGVPRRRALWIWGRGARCSEPSEAWRSSSRICSRPTLGWGIEGGWSRGQRRPGLPISWPGNWDKGQWSWRDSSPFRRGSLCNRSSFARSGSPLESLATALSDFSSLPAKKNKKHHHREFFSFSFLFEEYTMENIFWYSMVRRETFKTGYRK